MKSESHTYEDSRNASTGYQNLDRCNVLPEATIPFVSCGMVNEVNIKCEEEFLNSTHANETNEHGSVKIYGQDYTEITNIFDIPVKTESVLHDEPVSIPQEALKSLPFEGGLNVRETSTNGMSEPGCFADRNDCMQLKEVENLNQFECDYCKMSFLRKCALLNHVKAHEDLPRFKCHDCSKTFSSRFWFKRHVNSHEGKLSFKCDHCMKVFNRKTILANHIKMHMGIRPFVCKHCGAAFVQRGNLVAHVKSHVKNFKCTFCTKTFANKTDLSKHLISHRKTCPFKCPSCMKSFKCEKYLQTHMKVHGDSHPFICDYCSKGFFAKGYFQKHIISHLVDEPYKCRYCDKAFKSRGKMCEHRRIHECPHVCQKCNARFRDNAALVVHRRIHEHPFVCVYCNANFFDDAGLKKHVATAHTFMSKSLNSELSGTSSRPIIPVMPNTSVSLLNYSGLVCVMPPIIISTLPLQVNLNNHTL